MAHERLSNGFTVTYDMDNDTAEHNPFQAPRASLDSSVAVDRRDWSGRCCLCVWAVDAVRQNCTTQNSSRHKYRH